MEQEGIISHALNPRLRKCATATTANEPDYFMKYILGKPYFLKFDLANA